MSLPQAPLHCQGGGAPSHQTLKTGAISKTGALKVTISYSSSAKQKPYATATVKGNFYTFGSSTPVFQGTVKSIWAAAKECGGQASFEAIKG